MDREWRRTPCPNYWVSDDGMVKGPRGLLRLMPKPIYLRVKLFHDGQAFYYYVHQLVCMAWHGPCPGKDYQVAHRDGNKFNNVVENVRWATVADNRADDVINGSRRRQRGSNHYASKFSIEDIEQIRMEYATGQYTYTEIGKSYEVAYTTIRDIVQRKSYVDIA